MYFERRCRVIEHEGSLFCGVLPIPRQDCGGKPFVPVHDSNKVNIGARRNHGAFVFKVKNFVAVLRQTSDCGRESSPPRHEVCSPEKDREVLLDRSALRDCVDAQGFAKSKNPRNNRVQKILMNHGDTRPSLRIQYEFVKS